MRAHFGGLLAGTAVLAFAVLVLGASSAAATTGRCMVINDRINTTYHWDKKDAQPVQTAIDAAAPGDTLWLRGDCPGQITITKSLTLTGQDKPGFLPPNLRGDSLTDQSDVTVKGSDIEVQINSLAIQYNGNSRMLNTPEYGGGISNDQATLTLNNVTVAYNYARYGAGIYNNQGSIELTDSTIDSNGGRLPMGSGIYTVGGSITLNTSAITNNRIASYGGGILTQGSTVVANGSEISGNQAQYGGGIATSPYSSPASTITLTDTKIDDNSTTTSGKGGGIYSPNATVTLAGSSELAGNRAYGDGGGAIGGTMTVSGDATIHGNTAGLWGGGVYAFHLTLSGNASVYDNGAPRGGGVYVSTHLTMSGSATIHDNDASQGGGIYAYNSSYLTGCTGGPQGDPGVNVYNNTPDNIYLVSS